MKQEYLHADTTTSQFSAVNIGHNTVQDRHKGMRQYFKQEAGLVNEFMKGVHHTQKDRYMQVAYSSTVNKLTEYKREQAQLKSLVDVAPTTHHLAPEPKIQSAKEVKYSEFVNTINSNVKSEFTRNDRRLRYNKECGRKSVVDEIMSGKPSADPADNKVYLFAHKATHSQILALTGKLSMPDVRIEPPEMPRRRRGKWDILG